jgi:hypothetical protein
MYVRFLMRIRSTPLAAAVIAVAAAVPAVADTPLPDSRTHIDAAGEGPRLTLLAPDTSARDVRRGYLYIKAKCSQRCEVDVTARTRINGKVREVATARKTLPSRRTRRVKMRIKRQYRAKVSPNARFSYRAVPFPADE